MYLPMVAGAGATGLLVTGSGGKPITYLASGMMALSMVGMAFSGMGRTSGEKRRRLDGDRRDYQRYLEQVRRRVRRAAEQQRASALWHHPDPDALWCVVAGHPDVGASPGRRGLPRRPRRPAAPGACPCTLVPPETKPIEDLEPISAAALRRFVRTHSTVPDLPAALALPAFGRLALTGSQPAGRALARAMVGQLATFHSPDDADRRGLHRRPGRRGVGVAQVAAARPEPHRGRRRRARSRLISDDLRRRSRRCSATR